MKIRAIRLKEVGRFSEPVALEGLTRRARRARRSERARQVDDPQGGEARAVRAAHAPRHARRSRRCARYAGGAPLIEVDFEIDGNDLAHPQAVPVGALGGAARTLRRADVRAAAMPRRSSPSCWRARSAGRFALLWVDQGNAARAAERRATADGALLAAVENEVESVADGGAARFVAARVQGRARRARHQPQSAAPDRRATRRRSMSSAISQLRREAAERGLPARRRGSTGWRRCARRSRALADPAAATAARGKPKADAERALRGRARGAREAAPSPRRRCARTRSGSPRRSRRWRALEAKIADLSKLEEAAARGAAARRADAAPAPNGARAPRPPQGARRDQGGARRRRARGQGASSLPSGCARSASDSSARARPQASARR